SGWLSAWAQAPYGLPCWLVCLCSRLLRSGEGRRGEEAQITGRPVGEHSPPDDLVFGEERDGLSLAIRPQVRVVAGVTIVPKHANVAGRHDVGAPTVGVGHVYVGLIEGLAIEVHCALAHLHTLARQADHALDVIFMVDRRVEDDDVAAIGAVQAVT